MGLWSDLPNWSYRGPTVNHGGTMYEQRGIVVHIAEGSYEGTISWQKNPDASVSSHFVVDYDGKIAQVIDTDIIAWTQVDGNGHWISIENAGFHTGTLTAQQQEANAQIYAKAVKTYHCSLSLAGDPTGKGLGWHGMGGANWGGHYDCPGPNNVALLPSILARATQIVNGVSPTPPRSNDMGQLYQVSGNDNVYLSDNGFRCRYLTYTDFQRYCTATGIDINHPPIAVCSSLQELLHVAGPLVDPAAPAPTPPATADHTHDLDLAGSTGPAKPA